ncbi:MAG: hypothetical protein PHU17_00725 [Candidatus Pacebacteria bacterium]|nr:hypothetical protein [Candidatus Paceibacterota bacterium]
MAIEISPVKKETHKSKDNLLIVLIVLLLISFITYIIISFVFLPQKQAEIVELNGTLSSLNNDSVRANINELNIATKYINDFKILYTNSPKLSNFFESFKLWAHPNITYSNIKIDSVSRKVTMSGKTSSNPYLMEQIAIWQKEESIDSHELSQITIDENGAVSFNVSIFIKASLLK